jgi:enoyl-CoA hydratase/carnithine racemase
VDDRWTLEPIDGVWLFTMENGENLIDMEMLNVWSEVLDRVEGAKDLRSLVVTGTGRFWSTGLNLEEVGAYSDTQRIGFMNQFDRLLGRILTAPFVTVAALNGHTIAGGALLALAHDYRIMRENRGFISFPSVDVGIPFTPGMSALISAKIPQPAAHDLVVSCRQIGGSEAHSLGVVTGVTDEDTVVTRSLHLAASLSPKNPEALRTVKQRLYPEASAMLTPTP